MSVLVVFLLFTAALWQRCEMAPYVSKGEICQMVHRSAILMIVVPWKLKAICKVRAGNKYQASCSMYAKHPVKSVYTTTTHRSDLLPQYDRDGMKNCDEVMPVLTQFQNGIQWASAGGSSFQHVRDSCRASWELGGVFEYYLEVRSLQRLNDSAKAFPNIALFLWKTASTRDLLHLGRRYLLSIQEDRTFRTVEESKLSLEDIIQNCTENTSENVA